MIGIGIASPHHRGPSHRTTCVFPAGFLWRCIGVSIRVSRVSIFERRLDTGAVWSWLKGRVGSKKFVIALGLIVVCVVGWPFLSGLTSALFGSVSGDLAIRREVVKGLEAAKPFQAAVTKRYTAESFVCTSNESCDMEDAGARRYSIAIGKRAAITITYSAINPGVDGRTVILKPRKSREGIRWDCRGGTLQALYRPAAFRAKTAAEG